MLNYQLKHKEKINLLQSKKVPKELQQKLDEALELFIEKDADSVISMTEIPHSYSPDSAMLVNKNGELKDYLEGKKIYLRQNKNNKLIKIKLI